MQLAEYLSTLEDRIDSHRLKIAVIGLGYVGLPTAIAFHNAGFNVVGIDVSTIVIDRQKIDHLKFQKRLAWKYLMARNGN